MPTPTPRIVVLDVKAFTAACKRRGAVTEQQQADLIGVHRTTIFRATKRGQKIGPEMHAALITTFGDDAAKLMKAVRVKSPAA
jgi:plasmid maintenance system antidote protein VapI